MEVACPRCYLCGAPTSEACPMCRRPVCAVHLADFPPDLVLAFGPQACVPCVQKSVAQVEKERRQRERQRAEGAPYRTCAVCGREFSRALPACTVCGRHLCREHRVRYRRRFRFGHPGDKGAWYWDYDVRCLEHRRRLPRWQGWEVDATPSETEDQGES